MTNNGVVPNDQRVWERIPEHGPLVYWRMRLSRNVYLAVSRGAKDWHWFLRGPEFSAEDGYEIHNSSSSGTVAGAKRAAERAVLEPHCINCDTALDTGTADIFHCPGCGDEWSPELWPYYLPDGPA